MLRVKRNNQRSEELNFFLRYEDDIVKTLKGDQEELLNAASQLHSNLQSTLEKAIEKSNLASLDITLMWIHVKI